MSLNEGGQISWVVHKLCLVNERPNTSGIYVYLLVLVMNYICGYVVKKTTQNNEGQLYYDQERYAPGIMTDN
jgi:hypothetical protein